MLFNDAVIKLREEMAIRQNFKDWTNYKIVSCLKNKGSKTIFEKGDRLTKQAYKALLEQYKR